VDRRLVHIRDQLGMAAHRVEPSTAIAPSKKRMLAHEPRCRCRCARGW
jgi:hypothetical protein